MILRSFAILWLLISGGAYAIDLELTQGINSALPIAVNPFGNEDSARELGEVIEHDLSFSGQFNMISGPSSTSTPKSVPALKQLGADSVVTGHVISLGSNRYEVSFELVDAVAQGRLLIGKSFKVNRSELRPLAHHISDLVYQKLTGERGIFSTRIAYISVQKQGNNGRYTLEVADVDGHNPQSLLVSTEPIMSPNWSPDGRQIAYVSFEKKRAQIYTVNVETGQRRLISSFPGINNAPAWSTDGRQLAVVLSKSGSAKIYSIELSNGSMKQLTFGDAIDTEPRYTPDGKGLLFTSGRGGSPQVYRLSLADGKIARLTFDGNYNARATITPDQQNLIMLHRTTTQFNIAVQPINGGTVNVLTGSYIDESPSISPNGRLILYATRHNDQGVLGIVSIDGRVRLRLPARQGDVQEPAWSPFLG